jgi:hypothetical protein
MWFRRFPLPPRKAAEVDVWVQACVHLLKPVTVADGSGPPAVGYFRNVGLRIPGPQPRSFLERLFPDGIVDWSETEVTEVNPSTLDRDIRALVTAPDSDGVWYRSGRLYFPEDDLPGAA